MFHSVNNRPRVNVFEVIKETPKEYQCPVDQFDGQDFNKNDAGWIRNDISQLARATSQSQYDAIMRRLVELKQEGGIPDGTTIEQAIGMIKPRYAQSPNELEEFMNMTNADFMKRLDEAYQKSLKDVSQPASALDTATAPVPVVPE